MTKNSQKQLNSYNHRQSISKQEFDRLTDLQKIDRMKETLYEYPDGHLQTIRIQEQIDIIKKKAGIK